MLLIFAVCHQEVSHVYVCLSFVLNKGLGDNHVVDFSVKDDTPALVKWAAFVSSKSARSL